MFGNDDDNQTDQVQGGAPAVTPAFPAASSTPADTPQSASTDLSASMALPTVLGTAISTSSSQPAEPPADDNVTLDSLAEAEAEAPETPALPEPSQHEEEPAEDTHSPVPSFTEAEPKASDTNSDDLLGIKQQALAQLSPLVGHLDQTPEERFKTTMMMIQAADNKDLVKVAYEAAQSITDEKVRAQALLDIINEINYFTQQSAE